MPDTDHRPTGAPQSGHSAARWQHRLDGQLTRFHSRAFDEWGDYFRALDRRLGDDPFTPTLATRVAQVSSAGISVRALLEHAISDGPLPDEHPAAALWWRISGRLNPAVTQDLRPDHHLAASWLPQLQTHLGQQRTEELRCSTWWPGTVTAIEHALQQGWTLDAVARMVPADHDGLTDTCQGWLWRLTLATQHPAEDTDVVLDPPPSDLTEGWAPTDHLADMIDHSAPADLLPMEEPVLEDADHDDPDVLAERTLAIEALVRAAMSQAEPTAAEIRRQQDRADAWRRRRYTPQRLAYINELTTQFYEAHLAGSWAQPYLAERLHQDLTGHPTIRPGYAPDSWNALIRTSTNTGSPTTKCSPLESPRSPPPGASSIDSATASSSQSITKARSWGS